MCGASHPPLRHPCHLPNSALPPRFPRLCRRIRSHRQVSPRELKRQLHAERRDDGVDVRKRLVGLQENFVLEVGAPAGWGQDGSGDREVGEGFAGEGVLWRFFAEVSVRDAGGRRDTFWEQKDGQ